MKPATTPSVKFTYDDFVLFPDDGKRHAVFLAPFDVVFSNLDVVEPDLLYISRARRSVLTDKHVRGAPDLVVEVLSPGTRKTDEITKRKLYERRGVQEYWIVDPVRDTIKTYRRIEGALALATELLAEHNDTLTEIFASAL